nr:hypothetical protein [Providencia rettgeri]
MYINFAYDMVNIGWLTFIIFMPIDPAFSYSALLEITTLSVK